MLVAGIKKVADPKITLASAAAMFLGVAAASRSGMIPWGWLLVTIVGVFALEAAKNASGEIFDFDSGADTGIEEEDRSPFSGGKRVLVDGVMTRRQTAWVAGIFYAVGVSAGMLIVLFREPRVLWFGLAGVLLAYTYNAPPVRLSYRGLGEVAVMASYGPLICCGTYLALRREISQEVVLVSIPLGLMTGAFLWINEFPDRRADEKAGKRNLVVRLGPHRAAWVFVGLIAFAYLVLLLFPLSTDMPLPVALGCLGLPHAVAASRRLVRNHGTTARLVPAQAWTLGSFVLMAVGAGLGLVLG